MASVNKQRKAKNSFLYNGAEAQKGCKGKRIWYFTKADRKRNKDICKEGEQTWLTYTKQQNG